MENLKQIMADVTVGPQPMVDEFQQLQEQGFKSIINFRHDGEDHQPISPRAEGELVERMGMVYFNVPVSLGSLTPSLVDDFRAGLEKLPKPVFAHCKLGTRAGLMMMMAQGIEHGRSGEQTADECEKQGFKFNTAETRSFVTNYVDSRSHRQAPVQFATRPRG